jgi:ABC-2 type transport system ATP-binding protein
MSTPILEARGLTKRYGKDVAVAGVDLVVKPGDVIGLLGPNGAGKTTTILMLLGLTEASSGTVRIEGKDPLRDPLAVKQIVGYLPDAIGFYDSMTARENLAYTARLAGLSVLETRERIDTALERVRLRAVADKRVATFSRGMRQRLGIAELLMRDCRMAILDEPTSGLDPQSTQELLDLIKELSEGGMTILLSSHMLDVVQSICDRVALFNKGRVGFFGTVEALADQLGRGSMVIDVEAEAVDLETLGASIDGLKGITTIKPNHWSLEASRDIRPDVARVVVEAGGQLKNLDLRRARLDEAYNRYFAEVANAA